MINCTRIDARGHNKNNGNMFDYMLATERLAIDSAVAYYAGSGPDPRQTLNWGGSSPPNSTWKINRSPAG